MLPLYAQFSMSQAIRSQMQLFTPNVISTSEINLPRLSVIHMLNMSDDAKFPVITDSRLSNTPKAKRVPVLHIYNLTEENSVQAVIDKTAAVAVKDWSRDNVRSFRTTESLADKADDPQVNMVVNYNLLKSRYRYASTQIASHDRVNNMVNTVWETVSSTIKQIPTANQFVRLAIPAIIPSNTAITSLLKQKPEVYAKVISDHDLNSLLHLYTYLDVSTRHRSAMRGLTPEQTEQVTIELTHRGYSAFFKLSYLVSLSDENQMESKRKISPDKLQRLFVLMLLDVQTQAAMLHDKTQTTQSVDTATTPTVDDEDVDPETSLQDNGAKLTYITPEFKEGDVPQLNIDELSLKADKNLDVSDFDSAVAAATIDDKTDTTTLYSDDVFISAIQKYSQPEEDSPDTITVVDYSDEHVASLISDKSVSQIHDDYIQKAKLSGALTTADIRNMRKLVEQRASLKSPYSDAAIDTAKVINPQDLIVTQQDKTVPINNNLVPDHYKFETLFKTDQIYISKTLPKDILGCVTHLEKANVVIKAYEVEKVKAVTGFYDIHKLTLKPLGGKESTVYFRIPDINKEGEFEASGIRYRMRRQRTDLPIRKISPTKVALTTNYGKLFVLRSERKAYDALEYLVDKVKKSYLDDEGVITKVVSGYAYDNKRKTPNTYAKLSMNFLSIQTKEHTFVFSDKLSQEQIDPALYASMKATQSPYSASSIFPCGYTAKKEIIVLKSDNNVYKFSPDNNHTLIGPIEELLGVQPGEAPKSFSAVKILGDAIPLGVVLSYYLGIKGLIAATQTTFTTIGSNQRHTPAADETVLRFQDVKVILKTDTVDKQLLFAGFLFYKDFIKTHDFITFDDKNIYLDLISYRDAGVMHLKEMDTLRVLFIDPISERVLQSMKEPHEYLKLLLRANNLLSDLEHPDVNDMNYARIRGYDRVPGLMYRVLSSAIRTHKLKGNGKGKIELDPYEVWNTITQDTTVKITEETNPVVDAKDVESATFSGVDGLSKGATPELLRRYHKSDKGVISEATVDSSDVGLNFFLTPNPNFTDVNGLIGEKSGTPDSNFSTSSLLAPMCEHDD